MNISKNSFRKILYIIYIYIFIYIYIYIYFGKFISFYFSGKLFKYVFHALQQKVNSRYFVFEI